MADSRASDHPASLHPHKNARPPSLLSLGASRFFGRRGRARLRQHAQQGRCRGQGYGIVRRPWARNVQEWFQGRSAPGDQPEGCQEYDGGDAGPDAGDEAEWPRWNHL